MLAERFLDEAQARGDVVGLPKRPGCLQLFVGKIHLPGLCRRYPLLVQHLVRPGRQRRLRDGDDNQAGYEQCDASAMNPSPTSSPPANVARPGVGFGGWGAFSRSTCFLSLAAPRTVRAHGPGLAPRARARARARARLGMHLVARLRARWDGSEAVYLAGSVGACDVGALRNGKSSTKLYAVVAVSILVAASAGGGVFYYTREATPTVAPVVASEPASETAALDVADLPTVLPVTSEHATLGTQPSATASALASATSGRPTWASRPPPSSFVSAPTSAAKTAPAPPSATAPASAPPKSSGIKMPFPTKKDQ